MTQGQGNQLPSMQAKCKVCGCSFIAMRTKQNGDCIYKSDYCPRQSPDRRKNTERRNDDRRT